MKFFIIFDHIILRIIWKKKKYSKKKYTLSKKFLKNGGLIIGDDYEIKFSDVDFNILNSKKNNEDISFENKKKISFHPGVTMAVYKHFGNIKPINGIFVIKKNRNKFLPYKFKI